MQINKKGKKLQQKEQQKYIIIKKSNMFNFYVYKQCFMIKYGVISAYNRSHDQIWCFICILQLIKSYYQICCYICILQVSHMIKYGAILG